jgi:hypothetical protein
MAAGAAAWGVVATGAGSDLGMVCVVLAGPGSDLAVADTNRADIKCYAD